ncbi:unnamed protein product [Caenorhabditis sp. 36 PRJEB53466]|nr:unnamed protein product [Caenorhabditis sp. 36 PRJEB53466]
MFWIRFSLLVLLAISSDAFYVKNQNASELSEGPVTAELRSKKDSIELFGQSVEVPTWMNTAAEKTRGMFDSATGLFGKGTATSRKSSDGLMTGLKKDEATRIMFAVYLNILAIILIYVFITIKLALLSLNEGQEERRKRSAFSSHVAFDAPDYNLPLTSIATRNVRPSAPMTIDNPMAEFEMAREVREEEVLQAVDRLDYDAVPSTERDESF